MGPNKSQIQLDEMTNTAELRFLIFYEFVKL